MRASAPTLRQVAHAAGVSTSTASRVFTASPSVSDDARIAVEDAAQRLGYVPNRAARSLVTGRSDLVALVLPEPATELFDDPFFSRLVRGITEVLGAHDLQLVLLAPQSGSDHARVESYLAAGHVDGALLVPQEGDDRLAARLLLRGLPVVVAGRPAEDEPVSSVDVDNVAGAFTAVHHLIERRRRRIATITGPLAMAAGRERLDGFRRALRASGLPAQRGLEEPGDFSHQGGVQAMRALIERQPALDAVFAASDRMAAGALQVLRATGRRVPADVAVVGYEDSPIATTTLPPLSSVRRPIEEMGREMTRLLIAAIRSREHVPRRVVLGAELVIRASSAA